MATALAAARAKTKGKRMLRDALEGYGEDAFTLSEWNAKKRDAEARGTWTWKQSIANTNAAIKSRVERDGDARARFVDIQTAMEQEMSGALQARGGASTLLQQQEDARSNQCAWRDRIGGKQYHCTNDLPATKKNKASATSTTDIASTKTKRFCHWHARECAHSDHPMEKSRAIEIPNEFAMCLHCYEATATTQRATLQKTPPRVMAVKVPGVNVLDLRRDVQREITLKRRGAGSGSGAAAAAYAFTAMSVCTWQQEHAEKRYIWRCSNRVLGHPTLAKAFLSFCGFHAPRCIKSYGRTTTSSSNKSSCPPLDRLNAFGLCRNHFEAHRSTLSFDARGACVLVDSVFDVPGVRECSADTVVAVVTRHPLAPTYPPPSAQDATRAIVSQQQQQQQLAGPETFPALDESIVVRVLLAVVAFVARQLTLIVKAALNSSNPVSIALKDALWQLQFARRAAVVATRIQRIYRGNRARRRVRVLQYEAAALRRMHACCVLQRYVRGFVGCQRFQHERERVERAVPTIQRIVRGGLARKRVCWLRAAICLQHNYRCYRQRLLAWAFREEMAYMQLLQREADANLRDLEEKLAVFRRVRARRLLRLHIAQWRQRRDERARAFALRLQTYWSATKIQRQWRRHRRSEQIKKRYESAQMIQRRVRGWLTRHLWRGDPGIATTTSFVNPHSGFVYRKVVVLPQPSRSYAAPSHRIRMRCGCETIQRVVRGHFGRLRSNEQWLAMLRRWEWIGIDAIDASGQSSDSMSVGKERYGFLLPSHAYSNDRRRHMQPIARDMKAARGFAYQYQSILDLIKDRDGLRAWSHTHEQRQERQRRRQQEHQKPRQEASLSTSSHSRTTTSQQTSGAGSISLQKALYPVGARVRVAVYNTAERGRTSFHSAKVVRIHSSSRTTDSREQDDTTFDVEFDPVLVSIRGVRLYSEQHVHSSRLHAISHVDSVDPQPPRARRASVGRQIQQAISALKRDICDTRRRVPVSLEATKAADCDDARWEN